MTFKLALKNLTRQKRRNVILAAAIAFGFFVVTTIDGLTAGMVGNLENMITDMAGGTVMLGGYEKLPPAEEGGKSKLVQIIRDRDYVKNLVEKNHIDYKYLSCYTQTGGQMIFNGNKFITTVYGRDFEEKQFIQSLQIVKGSLENLKDPYALIINEKMAESMNLEIGDQVVYSTATIYGQNNVGDFTVAIITKANTFLDAMQAYAEIDTLNALVDIPEGGYTTFTINLKNKKKQMVTALLLETLIRADGQQVSDRIQALKTNPASVSKGIDKQFTDEEVTWEGVKYAIKTLDDQIPGLKVALNVVHIVTTVILIVILLIVMIGVSNTYRMVLYERIREIGTMRALGMTGRKTGTLFTTEAVILCVFGAVCGLILSVVTMTVVHFIPITNENLVFFLNKGHFTFTVSIGTVIFQYVLLIGLTVLAVLSSAKKAARLSPAEALRTVK